MTRPTLLTVTTGPSLLQSIQLDQLISLSHPDSSDRILFVSPFPLPPSPARLTIPISISRRARSSSSPAPAPAPDRAPSTPPSPNQDDSNFYSNSTLHFDHNSEIDATSSHPSLMTGSSLPQMDHSFLTVPQRATLAPRQTRERGPREKVGDPIISPSILVGFPPIPPSHIRDQLTTQVLEKAWNALLHVDAEIRLEMGQRRAELAALRKDIYRLTINAR
ncbi:MAG: hypothetical protein TREMPRED_000017 [Tremellales sp. Tagirdzhanova-0007]|nr:MAG: hypothetical protein TREMPRED_000017 [Tremellales sp. Tagirdzhanova-0007]